MDAQKGRFGFMGVIKMKSDPNKGCTRITAKGADPCEPVVISECPLNIESGHSQTVTGSFVRAFYNSSSPADGNSGYG